MAEALILDSEAVNALANPRERGVLGARARAILTTAHERRAHVRVPAPVLAEVCRGPRFDAPIDRILNGKGIAVVSLTPALAKTAGHLLARANLDSSHAVDAFVVATALSFESALIATSDPKDLRKLAAGHANLAVFAL